MSVANDANDVILIQIHRLVGSPSSARSYRAEKLASHRLDREDNIPKVCAGSILQKALQLKSRILSISTGPWALSHSPNATGIYPNTAMLVAVYGKQLCLLETTITLHESAGDLDAATRYQVVAGLKDHPLAHSSSKWAHCQIEGPLKWIHTVRHFSFTPFHSFFFHLPSILPADLFLTVESISKDRSGRWHLYWVADDVNAVFCISRK